MCSNNVLKEPAPKKPNFEEYSLRFHKFVQKVSQLPLDYSKAYLSLFDQIKPQKCLSRAVPTIEEIHQGFQIFLSRKAKTQKEDHILRYWSHKHVRIFLFLLASLECLTNHTPDLLPDIHWNSLSLLLPHTNAKSLKYRWVCLRDIHVKTLNNWTEQEDQTLKSIIEETNPELLAHNFNYFNPNYKQNQKIKWSFIAMELNQRIFKTNSMIKKIPKLGKHCRERWSNHLNPFLNKNDWTEIEDLQLLELSIKYERKWTKIAKEFPERTQHSVKNRYLSLIAREYKISRKNLSQKIISCKILQQNTLFNLKNRIQKNQPILDSQLLTFYDNEVKENKKEESLSEVDQWIGINKEEFSPENSFIFENKNDFNKEMKIIGRKKSENEMDLDSEKIWFS